MNTVIVDARGEQCPIPVVKAKKALQTIHEPSVLEIHVDNETAVQNVQRMAAGQNLSVKSEKLDDKHFVISISANGAVTSDDAPAVCLPDLRSETVVAIGSAGMGCGDETLGKTLMKGFIYALSQLETLPKTILFFNGGASIPCEGSVSVEDLKSMEAQGVEILTCGTCLDFYGLKDKLAVGGVTNMYTIVEKLNHASKVIKP